MIQHRRSTLLGANPKSVRSTNSLPSLRRLNPFNYNNHHSSRVVSAGSPLNTLLPGRPDGAAGLEFEGECECESESERASAASQHESPGHLPANLICGGQDDQGEVTNVDMCDALDDPSRQQQQQQQQPQSVFSSLRAKISRTSSSTRTKRDDSAAGNSNKRTQDSRNANDHPEIVDPQQHQHNTTTTTTPTHHHDPHSETPRRAKGLNRRFSLFGKTSGLKHSDTRREQKANSSKIKERPRPTSGAGSSNSEGEVSNKSASTSQTSDDEEPVCSHPQHNMTTQALNHQASSSSLMSSPSSPGQEYMSAESDVASSSDLHSSPQHLTNGHSQAHAHANSHALAGSTAATQDDTVLEEEEEDDVNGQDQDQVQDEDSPNTPPTYSVNDRGGEDTNEQDQTRGSSNTLMSQPQGQIQNYATLVNPPLPLDEAVGEDEQNQTQASEGDTHHCTNNDGTTTTNNNEDTEHPFSIRLTPFVDHSTNIPAFYIGPLERRVDDGGIIKIGRYTDKKEVLGPQYSEPIVFKSKVVSRTHAEFYVEGGQWYVKDVKSSSGTFLNHVRLSPACEESSPQAINDGDVLQLGMDFRGGSEDVFKCIKVRLELNNSWQKKVNNYNVTAINNLKNIFQAKKSDLQECSICLLPVSPLQALFIAPCSHAWHYKCIRPVVVKAYPHFLCPNCRSLCDLEADVECPDMEEIRTALGELKTTT